MSPRSPRPQIYLHKTGLMQQMLTNLAHGYHWYYTGTVAADRVLRFIEQIDLQYEITAAPRRREWRRVRYDQANAFLHLHPSYTEPSFHWWLMLTDGTHSEPMPPSPLLDARVKGHQRLVIPGDYEAVLRPAPGGIPRRTWQLTSATYENVIVRLQQAVRHRSDPRAVTAILREIHSYPAFRGVRSQVANLRRLAVADWRRIKPDSAPLILPPFPPYIRFRHFQTISVAIVRERLLAGEKPFTWEQMVNPIDPKVRQNHDAIEML
jgi:hypothetical protein